MLKPTEKSQDQTINTLEAFANHPNTPRVVGKTALGAAHVRGAVLRNSSTMRNAADKAVAWSEALNERVDKKLEEQNQRLGERFGSKTAASAPTPSDVSDTLNTMHEEDSPTELLAPASQEHEIK